jgi:hypothetical protein
LQTYEFATWGKRASHGTTSPPKGRPPRVILHELRQSYCQFHSTKVPLVVTESPAHLRAESHTHHHSPRPESTNTESLLTPSSRDHMPRPLSHRLDDASFPRGIKMPKQPTPSSGPDAALATPPNGDAPAAIFSRRMRYQNAPRRCDIQSTHKFVSFRNGAAPRTEDVVLRKGRNLDNLKPKANFSDKYQQINTLTPNKST